MRLISMIVAIVMSGGLLRGASVRQRGAPREAPVKMFQASEVRGRQVTLRIGIDRDVVGPGGATLLVEVTPLPRMHVYAPGQADYLPIVLTVESTPQYAVGQVVYPPAVELFLAPIKQRARVYDWTFQLRHPVN